MTNHCQKLQEKRGFTKRRVKKIVYKEVGERSDSDRHYDPDKDPDYNIRQCEVRGCSGEVWAACEKTNCEILLCFEHFIHNDTSCENHMKNENPEKLKWKEEDRNRTWLKIRGKQLLNLKRERKFQKGTIFKKALKTVPINRNQDNRKILLWKEKKESTYSEK